MFGGVSIEVGTRIRKGKSGLSLLSLSPLLNFLWLSSLLLQFGLLPGEAFALEEESKEGDKSSSEELVGGCSSALSSEEGRLFEMSGQADNCELVHVDFEVFGTVQGVFFRKYTQQEGKKLGLRGFCQNTSAGTVTGSMEGPRPAIEQMKRWLQTTGSPMSRISKAVFKNEKKIDAFTFPPAFDIARSV